MVLPPLAQLQCKTKQVSQMAGEMSDTLSLEKITQVFDRVKSTFSVADGHLEIITEDRYNDVIDIMATQFQPDETLCRAFGVLWNPFSEKKIRSVLKQNLSIVALSNDTNEVMGIRTCCIAKQSDKNDFSDVTYENVKALWTFLSHKDEEMDLFNRFGVSEILQFVTLAVHKKYRRRGLGSILLGAAVALVKELGFKAIRGEGTSNFSQRIYEKHGFETIVEIPYNEYEYKDGCLGHKTAQLLTDTEGGQSEKKHVAIRCWDQGQGHWYNLYENCVIALATIQINDGSGTIYSKTLSLVWYPHL